MPKNVMKLLKPSPNYGRNDFDLSHRTLFAANFGELIPAMCVETVPNDKIIIRISDLVRSQPMVTSPFLRAKQHVDLWFVPYNMLWSKFNEFIMDKDEPQSSALKDRDYQPYTLLSDLEQVIADFRSGSHRDIHGHNCVKQVCRNLDLMGYCGTLLDQSAQQTTQYADKGVNLWRLLAYNLIWYREYRQQYYDDGTFNLPSSLSSLANAGAYLFNVDHMLCATQSSAHLDYSIPPYDDLLAAIIQPRYRLWKKDLFTGLLPSTQFGNVSVVNGTTNLMDVLIKNRASSGINQDVTTEAQGYVIAGTGNTNFSIIDSSLGSSPVSNYDILALRKSEAIQKWRENSLRAGNQIEDNFEAHYGVKPKSHVQTHPAHIASISAPLNIGDIMATAETGQAVNGVLGDVAGKGIMSFDGSEAIQFETNDFGVVMAIYSILPEAEYNANGLDRLNALLEKEDYFFNEYENLGLEAVDKSVITDNTNVAGIIGYAPRYFGYKQKLDRVCGEFQSWQSYFGQFRFWVAPKFDVDSIAGGYPIPLSTLYVEPMVFNNNFNYSYNQVDQFLVDFYCDVEAIRQMSVSGMPGY